MMLPDDLVRKRFDELDVASNTIFGETGGGLTVDIRIAMQWGASTLNLLEQVYSVESAVYKQFLKHYERTELVDPTAKRFIYCQAIFRAAKEDYEHGYLFNLRSLVKAEVFEDNLEQATELLRAGYKDPACVVAGVTLETTLKELCDRRSISRASLDKMNVDLCKAGVYNMGWQKQITAWAERRNNAAHGNWGAYNEADVGDLIGGVRRFIAEHL